MAIKVHPQPGKIIHWSYTVYTHHQNFEASGIAAFSQLSRVIMLASQDRARTP